VSRDRESERAAEKSLFPEHLTDRPAADAKVVEALANACVSYLLGIGPTALDVDGRSLQRSETNEIEENSM
jgi:hypothetical protein